MDLYAKAKALGIQTEFLDGQGHRHVTAAAALKIILDALPVRTPYRFLGEGGVGAAGGVGDVARGISRGWGGDWSWIGVGVNGEPGIASARARRVRASSTEATKVDDA